MRGLPDIVAKVRTRVESTWATTIASEACAPRNALAGAAEPSGLWPHRFPLGKPAADELYRDFGTYVRQLPEWREWATDQGVRLDHGTRLVGGTRQEVLTHVCVDDLDTAARVAGGPWPDLIRTARARAVELRRRFPNQPDLARSARGAVRLSDVDFDILCRVSDWFLARASRTADGTTAPLSATPALTPRQVPIEGVHAKWLDSHQALVRTVTGLDDLGLLPPHPARFHFTYLDPDHLHPTRHPGLMDDWPGRGGGRRHDSYSVGDTVRLPYAPRVVLISENKDTAVGFPPVAGAIAVEGEGRGAEAIASAPWVQAAPLVVYWGDMDIDGLEILHEFRAAGLRVESMLMDVTTFRRYQRYGTNLDRNGKALTVRAPRDVPCLRPGEQELYALLTSGTAPVLRIEQERIPLDVARRRLGILINVAFAATLGGAGGTALRGAPRHPSVGTASSSAASTGDRSVEHGCAPPPVPPSSSAPRMP